MQTIYENIEIPSGSDVKGIAISGNRLCYSGYESEDFPEDLLRYTTFAESIDLSHNRISDIGNLGKFVKLKEVNLDNNKIDDDTEIPEIPLLDSLSLNKNNLTDCTKLVRRLREKCPNLKHLSLLGNEACPHPLLGYSEEEYQQSRAFIASSLPTLEIINFEEVTDEERGRPTSDAIEAYEQSSDEAVQSEADSESRRKAAAGKIKYTYVGKQSEGNRFIRNNQL